MGAGGGMPPPSPQPNPAPSAPVMPGGQPGFTDAMSAAINPPAPQPASAPAMPPPNPAGVATVASALSGQPPAAPARGPMSLSGNPQQDMYDYVTNRAEYTKALIASHAPVDIAKMMQQSGIDPNSPLGHQILQQNIAKQNYIAPIAMRPGGSVADPNDPSRILSVAPQAINGANPVLDSSGRFTGGYSAAPGAQSIEAGMAGAKAGAEAYGKAQFEPQTVVNPDGSSGVVSRAAALAPGGSGGAPGGSLNGHYGAGGASGGPVTTALSPARSAAMTTTGKASGDIFTGYQADAAASRDRTYQLGELQKINNGTTQFGPGAEQRSHVYGVLNTIGQSLGLPNSLVAQGKTTIDTAEFQKFSSQLVAASASKLGIPTDAKMQLLASSMGSLDKPNAANAKVFDYLLGNEAALRGKADAAAAWTQHNGPETAPQFETAFRQALDPRVYQLQALPSKQAAMQFNAMSESDKSAVIAASRKLKTLGAIQ